MYWTRGSKRARAPFKRISPVGLPCIRGEGDTGGLSTIVDEDRDGDGDGDGDGGKTTGAGCEDLVVGCCVVDGLSVGTRAALLCATPLKSDTGGDVLFDVLSDHGFTSVMAATAHQID